MSDRIIEKITSKRGHVVTIRRRAETSEYIAQLEYRKQEKYFTTDKDGAINTGHRVAEWADVALHIIH